MHAWLLVRSTRLKYIVNCSQTLNKHRVLKLFLHLCVCTRVMQANEQNF